MRYIITVGLMVIASTSYGAFSMADYEKAKAAKGEPVKTAPKVAEIVTDFALGIEKNKVRITSNESKLKQLIVSRSDAQSTLRKAEGAMTSANVNLSKVKARVNANKDKKKISTGHPKIREAAKVVAQCKYNLKMAKKSLAGMSLKIRNCERSLATARQKVIYYTNRLAKEKESAASCV